MTLCEDSVDLKAVVIDTMYFFTSRNTDPVDLLYSADPTHLVSLRFIIYF